MIYEAAVVIRPDAADTVVEAVKTIFSEVIESTKGEVLVAEDWGIKSFAQATSSGLKKGHYWYCMFRAGNAANAEITRRLGINENIVKNFIVKMGDDAQKDTFLKSYVNPFTKTF